MNEKYNAYVRSVADYFIEEMKKGTAPWQQDWDNAANVVPVSAVTDAPYRGTNALLLRRLKFLEFQIFTLLGIKNDKRTGNEAFYRFVLIFFVLFH